MKFAAVNYAADKSRIRLEIRRTWPVESQPCAGCYRGHAPARTRPSLLGAMRKCRAASNRSAVRVARDAGRPHPAIHMFAWLKSHFFCFLLLICAQGPAGRLGCNTAIARTISTTLSSNIASQPVKMGALSHRENHRGLARRRVSPMEVFCSTPVYDFPDPTTPFTISPTPKIVSTPVRHERGSARETLRRENPERGSRRGS